MKKQFYQYTLILLAILFASSINGQDSSTVITDSTVNDSFSRSNETTMPVLKLNQGTERYEYFSSPIRHVTVTLEGNIEFSENEREIVSISPGSYFLLTERRWFTTRKLEVRPGDDGKPTFNYRVRSSSFPFDEAAQAWLRETLPEVLDETGINTTIRINNYLAAGKTRSVFREIAHLGSSSRKRDFYLRLANLEGMDEGFYQQIVRDAGDEIHSSSELRYALTELAKILPGDEATTSRLIRAAENISSSSEKRYAISQFAENRDHTATTLTDLFDLTESISSSSEKGYALRQMASLLTKHPAATKAYLDCAATISSSSEFATTLITLASNSELDEKGWAYLAETAAHISSSSEKGRVLRHVAAQGSEATEASRALLISAASIESSSEKASVLRAFVSSRDLEAGTYQPLFSAVKSISSSSEKGGVMRMVANRETIRNFAEVDLFLDATETISSSSEMESVLNALLQTPELDEASLKAIMRFANTHINSDSSRRRIIDIVSSRMIEDI